MRRSQRARRIAAALGAVLVTAACTERAVRWDGEAGPAGAALMANTRLSLGAGGAVAADSAWMPPSAPGSPQRCPGSLVATRARGDTAFAAWWQARPDSSALLVVARSDDGGATWGAPVTADSTDRARTGCRRPAPFLGADLHNGYVHVAYFLVATEGPGVFFTHSMEGGTMFHAPVPIVYGERVSAAALATSGDTVAVAYLDPNSAAPQVWLALSHTTGHIFESRTAVSSENASALRPLVALLGNRVAVAWTETARGGGAERSMVRTGVLQ